MKIWHTEKLIDIESSIETDGSNFRLEIQRLSGEFEKYRVRLFRFELFRVTPTFGDYPNGGADHGFYITDPFLDGQEFYGNSVDDVVSTVVSRLRDQGHS